MSLLIFFLKAVEDHFSGDETKKLTPGVIFKLKTYADGLELWKAQMSLPNVPKNQRPRVWLAYNKSNGLLLALASHSDNYKDNDVQRDAEARIQDFN